MDTKLLLAGRLLAVAAPIAPPNLKSLLIFGKRRLHSNLKENQIRNKLAVTVVDINESDFYKGLDVIPNVTESKLIVLNWSITSN